MLFDFSTVHPWAHSPPAAFDVFGLKSGKETIQSLAGMGGALIRYVSFESYTCADRVAVVRNYTTGTGMLWWPRRSRYYLYLVDVCVLEDDAPFLRCRAPSRVLRSLFLGIQIHCCLWELSSQCFVEKSAI